MFFFCHLFAGVVLGISFPATTRIRTAVMVAVLGTILPDLIDKPMEYLVFPGHFMLGQAFWHTLPAFLFLLGGALLVDLWYRDHLVLLLPAAVLLHQVMDITWMDPGTWLSPFLGPLPPCNCTTGNYVGWGFLAEISSLSEWVFLGVTFLVVLLIFHERVAGIFGPRPARYASLLYPYAILLLGLMGLAAAISGVLVITTPLLAGTGGIYGDLMLATVSIAGAAILTRARTRLAL